ncbi:hypothetical protein Tco_1013581, partial [Tanacetum coccineum]
TWMAFGGNTHDLGSFGGETDEITELHQILEEVLLTKRGDGVASIKRHRRDLSGDGVGYWRWRHNIIAISVISVSSDSSEESVGTSIGRVILFEFDPSEDSSSDHIPPLPATSPFLSSTDDSSDNDIPNTPPSPTHGTLFTKTTLSTQRSSVASGTTNGPDQWGKRVGLLPTHSLAVRHSIDYSSLDYFSSDDSLRDSSSSSSSETSSRIDV